MILIEHTEVAGWEAAIRGMRNPMNSWDKSDTYHCSEKPDCKGCPFHDGVGCNNTDPNDTLIIGENDHDLMMRLAAGGSVHAKYRRMIVVWVDITAPLYWWKEFDTYKVGTVANSCSTMHKIHAKEFTLDDFSVEHLNMFGTGSMDVIIRNLNTNRNHFLETKDKHYWWQMIQLLPTSYNQRRTVMLNYEVLVGMYRDRKGHKLNEWVELCKWIETLPYSEVITCG